MCCELVGVICTPHELNTHCVVILPCECKRAYEMSGRPSIDKLVSWIGATVMQCGSNK